MMTRFYRPLIGLFCLIACFYVFGQFATAAYQNHVCPQGKPWNVPDPDLPEYNFLPAFPGAEGYGAMTKGGRGDGSQTPRIFVIDNLADSGPGTLRECIQASGPRFCIFTVSGYIWLESSLRIENPYITIDGQTAPGDGITIARQPLDIKTDDVIIRYLRVRLGDWECQLDENDDTIEISDSKRVILDHVSASWSIDETLSVVEDKTTDNITIQWSFITESLNDSCHDEGEHGMGSILGGDMERYQGITVHHSLYAHHRNRSPKFASESSPPSPPIFDFRNNVIYNWQTNSAYTSSDQCTMINYVGNYLKYGPNTPDKKRTTALASGGIGTNVYLSNNYLYERGDIGWQMIEGNATKLESAIPVYSVTTTDPQTAYTQVLAQAGASLPNRDEVDRRIVNEVRNRGGRIIDSQSQVGGWPNLHSASASLDSDNDGLPDEWENLYGLNPNNAGDNVIDSDGDGYLNIEEYLNGTVPAQPTPTPVESCLLGDSDCNQKVEFGDYSAWRTANWDWVSGDTGDCLGSGKSIYGDASCDGRVNNFDFSIWRSEMFD